MPYRFLISAFEGRRLHAVGGLTFQSMRALAGSLFVPLALWLLVGCHSENGQAEAVGRVQAEKAKIRLPAAKADLTVGSGDRHDIASLAASVSPSFFDVAARSGVDFQFYADAVPGRYFLPEVMGGGLGWCDFDRDGRLDLYVANGRPLNVTREDAARVASVPTETNRLYRQLEGGRFEEVAGLAAVDDDGYGQGIAAGDFDADGFVDLFLTNYGANVLFRNNGDGSFSDATSIAGVGDDRWGTSCLWFDADNDRLLDLYVANYMNVTPESHKRCTYAGKPGYCGPGSYEGVPNLLYLNRGDGTFIAAEQELGFTAEAGGKSLAVVAIDIGTDLIPEIYVANDMESNFLFARENDSASIRYGEIAKEAGCAFSGDGMNEASMGIACGDFDGDGRPDLFLTHYFRAKNTLYRNLGGMLFADESRASRVASATFETLGFGTVAGDFDRDGDLDLFMANGHVLGPEQSPNEMHPQLLQNDGRGQFSDVSEGCGDYFAAKMIGRGVAAADYDSDGDVDIAVSHLDRPLALLRNDTLDGRFIGFELVTEDRIPPVGGRLRVRAGESVRTYPVTAGGSYLSSSDDRIFAGLGDETGPVTVEVFWPSGQTHRWDGLEADRYWRLFSTGRPPAQMAEDSANGHKLH